MDETEKEKNLGRVVDNLSRQLQFSDGNNKKESESAQAIAELNKDIVDDEGNSTIDQHTELTHNQIVKLVKLEGLPLMKFMTGKKEVGKDAISKITRKFQRKLVSKGRKGRGETLQLFQEIESKKDAKGMWEKWFTPKK